MSIPHVFLTRFNLPSEGVESMIRAKEGWLRDRIVLFDRYSVPSVRGQDAGDVFWIVYLDPESPAWLKQRMSQLESEGLLAPIYRETVSDDDLAEDIRRVVGHDRGPVITSNLDNDDGLATDFVRRLRQARITAPRTALYVVFGLIKHGEQLFLRHDRDNAFCAVREDLTELRTCWADWHNRLSRHMPVVEVDGPPGWLQVVHGNNVSNRVRGRLVGPDAYRAAFPGLLDDVTEPSRTAKLRSGVVDSPVRFLRDRGRQAIRVGLVRIIGREGFDRLKYRGAGVLAGVRRRVGGVSS